MRTTKKDALRPFAHNALLVVFVHRVDPFIERSSGFELDERVPSGVGAMKPSRWSVRDQQEQTKRDGPDEVTIEVDPDESDHRRVGENRKLSAKLSLAKLRSGFGRLVLVDAVNE